MKISRVAASREKWKARAIVRGRSLRRCNRRLRCVERRVEALSTRAAELEAENLTLREARDAAARAPVTVVSPPSREDLRVVVVLVFAIGLIPCNAVSGCLEVLCRAGWLALSSVPHPSPVVNWVARAGLGKLLSVGKRAAPWVAMIDSSISYGKAKMLVVLRVRTLS